MQRSRSQGVECNAQEYRQWMQCRGVPRVEWRGLKGNFNTQNQYFLDLEISVDLSEISGEDPSFRMLSGNLWRYSEFQNV